MNRGHFLIQSMSRGNTCVEQLSGICGLFFDVNSKLPIVVKRSCLTILRPCEELEYFYLSSALKTRGNSSKGSFVSARSISKSSLLKNSCDNLHKSVSLNPSLSRDIILFLDLLQFAADSCGEIALRKFEDDLFHLDSPFEAAKAACLSFLDASSKSVGEVYEATKRSLFSLEFMKQYNLIRNPFKVFLCHTRVFRLQNIQPEC